MVEDAERRGLFADGRRLLDSTSGNTGIAYAMIGAAMGIPVTLCLPESASPERKRILQAYGAELQLTDPLAGSDGAILEARRLAAEEPDRYVYLDQYSNPENWRAHYRTTGPEIWEQTGGAITHFVTGLGTSGTFVGVGRFLREKRPGIRLISVEPDSPVSRARRDEAHGDGHRAADLRSGARRRGPELADREGARHGQAAGARGRASWSASRPAATWRRRSTWRPGWQEGVVVTVLCDGADKYLSDRFWEEA